MPRPRPAHPRPRGRPSIVDIIILVRALDNGPVSWADTVKEWNFKNLTFFTIRRRAFYRAIDKLTNLGLIHEANLGSYPASWIVGKSATEKKAVREYLAKREREILPPYSIGRENKAEHRKNVKVASEAYKILRQEAEAKGLPYVPKATWVEELKPIVEQNRTENRLLRIVKAERKKIYGRTGSLEP